MPFHNELAVSTIPGSPNRFVLEQDLLYEGKWDEFTVRAGFTTDLASVPRWLTWVAPRYGIYTRAAVLHDSLCALARRGEFSRIDADGIFRRVLRELGVGLPRRWMMWAAVRTGSLFADGISLPDLARVVFIGMVTVPLLSIPCAIVALFQGVFDLIEWALGPGGTSHGLDV
jgi:hypothetical protein